MEVIEGTHLLMLKHEHISCFKLSSNAKGGPAMHEGGPKSENCETFSNLRHHFCRKGPALNEREFITLCFDFSQHLMITIEC